MRLHVGRDYAGWPADGREMRPSAAQVRRRLADPAPSRVLLDGRSWVDLTAEFANPADVSVGVDRHALTDAPIGNVGSNRGNSGQ